MGDFVFNKSRLHQTLCTLRAGCACETPARRTLARAAARFKTLAEVATAIPLQAGVEPELPPEKTLEQNILIRK